MASIVIAGDTSGTVTLAAPATAGTTTLTLPTTNGTVITTGTTTGVNASAISTGTLAAARLPAGSVLQVVQNTSLSEYNLGSGDTGWIQLTNYNVSITPRSTSSRILLMATIPWYGIANGGATGDVQALFYRNTTQLNGGQPITTAYIANNTYIVAPMLFVDSPNTTNSVTYYIYGKGRYIGTGDYSYNRGGNGSVVITAMEIAG